MVCFTCYGLSVCLGLVHFSSQIIQSYYKAHVYALAGCYTRLKFIFWI